MLQFGTKITHLNDKLNNIPINEIFRGINKPKENFRQKIERLRMVRTIDPKGYANSKKDLPYFVCGHFHPPYRRSENFSYIQCFTVDLDNFSAADKDKNAVADILKKDQRTHLLFTSPGGDGLKVVFLLAEKCFYSGLYAHFYKAFIQKLALQYQLEAVIDHKTHDVTRACFMSVDNDAYFNPEAEKIVMSNYFDQNDPDAVMKLKKEHKTIFSDTPSVDKNKKEELSADKLAEMKKYLQLNPKPKVEKSHIVPPQLVKVMPTIKEILNQQGMVLCSERPIDFGTQIKVQMDDIWAEVNIWFGKKGFSVAKTTKTKSNADLAEVVQDIIKTELSKIEPTL